MDEEVILPYSEPYHPQQLYHSHLSWFKIITLTIQTDIGEAPNTRGRKGASTSDHKMKTSPFTIQIQRLDSRHNKPWLMQCKRILCRVCSTKNKETRRQYKCRECDLGCVLPHVSKYITPNCISENQLTLKWKSGTHSCK